jgi:hypothetical protein
MKWFFWTLLLANVAVFFWATGHGEHVPKRVAGPRPPVNADKMQLLGVAAATEDNSADASVPPATKPVASAGPAACYTVGPFDNAAQAAQGGRLLRQQNLVFAQRREQERVVDGYRIVVGPLPSIEMAERKHSELTAAGLEGHYIIESGLENAIALGFFSQLDKAEKFIRQLAAKGIRASLRPRSRRGDQLIWLDIGGSGLPPGLLAGLQQTDWGNDKVLVRPRNCQ